MCPLSLDLCPLISDVCLPRRTLGRGTYAQQRRYAKRPDKNGSNDRVPGEIVPAVNGRNILRGGDPDEKKCARVIAHERNCGGGAEKRDAPRDRQSLQFAKKEPDHERGLQRAHTAARFVHTYEPGAHPNQIAFQLGRNTEQVRRFACQRRDGMHQALNDRRFHRRHPRNCYEEEPDRKSKVTQPGRAAPVPYI